MSQGLIPVQLEGQKSLPVRLVCKNKWLGVVDSRTIFFSQASLSTAECLVSDAGANTNDQLGSEP